MERIIQIGIAGLGVGAVQVVKAVAEDPRFQWAAACDVRSRGLAAFHERFGGRTYENMEDLCADPDVEVVWISTPNHLHAEHTIVAAEHGKHVVIEKPMALSLAEAERMVDACDAHGVELLCGHTAKMMPAYQAMRRVVTSGMLGKLRAVNVWSFSDWMLRPRMQQELDVSLGGGVVYRQAPLQVDVVRLLGGGSVRSVRAMTGDWFPPRPAPGYYSAFLEFDDGTPVTLVHDGYGYFSTYELVPWGGTVDEAHVRKVRRALNAEDRAFDEEALKEEMRFGGEQEEGDLFGAIRTGRTGFQGDVGLVLANCERGDFRQSPGGLWIYDDDGRREIPVDQLVPDIGTRSSRLVELDELYDALTNHRPVRYGGRWGVATLEVVLGIMQSARERKEVLMSHQCPVYWEPQTGAS